MPALDSLKLPEIRDIRITPQGVVVPSFEMGSTPVAPDTTNPFAPTVTEVPTWEASRCGRWPSG